MISIFDKPDTTAQTALAVLCSVVMGHCWGVLSDRLMKQRAPWQVFVVGWILAALVSWFRRLFV